MSKVALKINIAGRSYPLNVPEAEAEAVSAAAADINKAIELDGGDVEQKLFKAQILWLYSFDKNAVETRQLVDEYIDEVKDNQDETTFKKRKIQDEKPDEEQATKLKKSKFKIEDDYSSLRFFSN